MPFTYIQIHCRVVKISIYVYFSRTYIYFFIFSFIFENKAKQQTANELKTCSIFCCYFLYDDLWLFQKSTLPCCFVIVVLLVVVFVVLYTQPCSFYYHQYHNTITIRPTHVYCNDVDNSDDFYSKSNTSFVPTTTTTTSFFQKN